MGLRAAINGQIGGVNAFFYNSPGGEVHKFAAVVPDFLFRKGPGHRRSSSTWSSGAAVRFSSTHRDHRLTFGPAAPDVLAGAARTGVTSLPRPSR